MGGGGGGGGNQGGDNDDSSRKGSSSSLPLWLIFPEILGGKKKVLPFIPERLDNIGGEGK